MKKHVSIFAALAALILSSCVHKELCYNHEEHALRYHVQINSDYRQEWEEHCTPGFTNWQQEWPSAYMSYDEIRPGIPSGLRVINFTSDGASHITNLPAEGGIVNLAQGSNDLLFYNNDTEYIVFTDMDQFATTRATTRTRTRATYLGNPYDSKTDEEETVNPPDMLYGNFRAEYTPEKVEKPAPIDITLHPLVFTYKVRYEFEAGLKYVAIARGALSGMAKSVNLATGTTSDEVATVLYDCEMTDFGAKALVNSFGAPGYPNGNYTKGDAAYGLNLEVRLRNGNMKTFNFDVTDQVKAQPHGGVIVVKGIVIPDDEGMSGSGAFDVEVNDWGDYEDIEIPLL